MALNALALEGQAQDAVLEEMIPGLSYIVEAEMPRDGNRAGWVASEIRREGLEQAHHPNKVSAMEQERVSEFFVECNNEQELAAFAKRELLVCKIRDANLSPQEGEPFFSEYFLATEQQAKF
jgi:hypothetical protein